MSPMNSVRRRRAKYGTLAPMTMHFSRSRGSRFEAGSVRLWGFEPRRSRLIPSAELIHFSSLWTIELALEPVLSCIEKGRIGGFMEAERHESRVRAHRVKGQFLCKKS